MAVHRDLLLFEHRIFGVETTEIDPVRRSYFQSRRVSFQMIDIYHLDSVASIARIRAEAHVRKDQSVAEEKSWSEMWTGQLERLPKLLNTCQDNANSQPHEPFETLRTSQS